MDTFDVLMVLNFFDVLFGFWCCDFRSSDLSPIKQSWTIIIIFYLVKKESIDAERDECLDLFWAAVGQNVSPTKWVQQKSVKTVLVEMWKGQKNSLNYLLHLMSAIKHLQKYILLRHCKTSSWSFCLYGQFLISGFYFRNRERISLTCVIILQSVNNV